MGCSGCCKQTTLGFIVHSHKEINMELLHMNYKRQIGQRIVNSYDFAIKRLKCYSDCEFYGLSFTRPETEEPPIFACKFCSKTNFEHLLALANEDGMIGIQDTNLHKKRTHTEVSGIQAHHNAIFDLAWMEGEMKLVTVSGDHTAVLWDVHQSTFSPVHCFKGHTRSVKVVVFRPEDKAVFATGARDGIIMIWDSRSNRGPALNRPDNCITNSHFPYDDGSGGFPQYRPYNKGRRQRPSSRANSITGLVFQDENHLISCGAGDGLVKVWDLRKNYSVYKREPLPLFTLPHPGRRHGKGFTNLVLDPSKVRLYASCMDSAIYCYNVATYEKIPVAVFGGHYSSTFYVKSCLSPDGLYLASGSGDSKAYIWNTRCSSLPIATLMGHDAEVTTVQWCPVGPTKIVTCSDDSRHRIWQTGKEYEDLDNPHSLKGWAEEPSGLNFMAHTLQRRKTKIWTNNPAGLETCSTLPEPKSKEIMSQTKEFFRLLTEVIPDGRSEKIIPSSLQIGLDSNTSCTKTSAAAEKEPTPNISVDNEKTPHPTCSSSPQPNISESEDMMSPSKKIRFGEHERTLNTIGSVNSYAVNEAITPCAKKVCTSDQERAPTATSSPSPQPNTSKSDEIVPFAKRVRSDEQETSDTICSAFSESCAVYKEVKSEEVTPRMKKIRAYDQEITPETVVSRPITEEKEITCQNCEGEEVTRLREESSNRNLRSSKRRLADFLDGAADKKRRVLSPVREENHESKTVLETRSAKRLFSPQKGNDNELVLLQSPISASHSSGVQSSPTLNLPNYVIDGTSPHHRCSPNYRHKENVDWLTKLRKEKTSSGEIISSPNSQVTPKRRSLRLRSQGKSSSPKGETLLRFFRVAGKPSNETWNCTSVQAGVSASIPAVEL